MASLKRQLSTCRKDIFQNYLKWIAEEDGEQVRKKMKVESATTSCKPVTAWMQPTLHSVAERSVDHEITQWIDKCVMDMIAVYTLPYTVVKGEAFKRLNFCDPHRPRCYKLSRKINSERCWCQLPTTKSCTKWNSNLAQQSGSHSRLTLRAICQKLAHCWVSRVIFLTAQPIIRWCSVQCLYMKTILECTWRPSWLRRYSKGRYSQRYTLTSETMLLTWFAPCARLTSVTECRKRHNKIFTACRHARIASAVLATAIPSVCPSVCLSVCHTLVLCQNNCM